MPAQSTKAEIVPGALTAGCGETRLRSTLVGHRMRRILATTLICGALSAQQGAAAGERMIDLLVWFFVWHRRKHFRESPAAVGVRDLASEITVIPVNPAKRRRRSVERADSPWYVQRKAGAYHEASWC